MSEQQQSEQPDSRSAKTILHITSTNGKQSTFQGDLQALLLFYAHHPHLAHQLEGMHIAIERLEARNEESGGLHMKPEVSGWAVEGDR
jgi:dethiobiotin synthetase